MRCLGDDPVTVVTTARSLQVAARPAPREVVGSADAHAADTWL